MASDNESTSEHPEGGEDAKPSLFDQPPGHDWLLAWLIALAENFGMETGVTLSVGGMTVTGMIISGRTYFEESAKAVSPRNVKGNDAGAVANAMAKGLAGFALLYPKWDGESEPPPHQPTYIHMKNAYYIGTDGKMIPSHGILFRAKMAAIDGFSMGEMQPQN